MYETIKELEEKGLFQKAVESGLISITVAGQKMIYEIYLKIRQQGYKDGFGKRQSVLRTSIETKTSEANIYSIIKRMEN